MRAGLIIAVAAVLFTGTASAQYTTSQPEDRPSTASPSAGQTPSIQQTPPADTRPSNPAIRPPESNVQSGPAAGANSFTEAEVKSRIEAQGFANVTELKKSDDGIWLGMAQREGLSFQVALDYRGNVFFRPAS
jgi:hypothetical protein